MVDWSRIEDSELFDSVGSAENLEHVLEVMSKLSVDPNWTQVVVNMVQEGQLETRCFLSWLAEAIQPSNYLELGVRRGFSMSTVASRAPRVNAYGFDLWVRDYGGSENPGPEFVKGELAKVGHTGNVVLVSGNSHKTLPAFFDTAGASWFERRRVRRIAGTAPAAFDLILVDADHSLLGAYQDLMDTLPHLAVGGAIVFDDVAPSPADVDPEAMRLEAGEDPHGWGDLLGVWHAALANFPELRTFEYLRNTPGVAIAVRGD